MTTDPVLRTAVPEIGPSVPVLQPGSSARRDRLVELRVLVEHGDVEAAGERSAGLAEDGSARRHRELVERDCLEIRPGLA